MTSFKQKLAAILVLSLFLLSVMPAGLADEGNSLVNLEAGVEAEVEAEVSSDSADAEVNTEVNAESEAEVEAEENDSEIEENGFKIKEEIRAVAAAKAAAKIRAGAKKIPLRKELQQEVKVLRNARERLEEAKDRYQEAMEKQREQRQKVLELSKLIKRCNPKEKDCPALKVELRLGVKNHLQKSIQVVERSLEKLTKTVEKMEGLPEDEKEAALGLIADLESLLDAQKAKIEGFTSETSQEEIRAAIKDLKELNQKVHKLQRRLVGLLVNAKLSVLVEKQAELHAGMQARIDALAAEGADVSELEEILAEFDAKTEELKQDYETAKQKWMEAKDEEDFDQFNRNLREAQHQVREDLQEIKQILRKFLQKHKEIKQSLTGEETEEESEENETEEESEESVDVESNASAEANAGAETTA